ncbi:MAG: lipoate--protein ligase family protein [Spirochaetales bacterium]|nr:lipoate--protein ligase family protein [Spirochaetales bacterium]
MVYEKIVVYGGNRDIYYNLAFEEYALNHLSDHYSMLFLWQTDKAIVIGRFQNPYKECDVEQALENDIRIGRRISGGGAVYHDEGNLNFSFITARQKFDRDRNFSIILNVLKEFSINAVVSGDRDILIEGKKISGNAFCHRKTGSLHHGTLLVRSNLANLQKYLEKPGYSIYDHAVPSRPGVVENLSRLNEGLTIYKIQDAIASEFVSGKFTPVPPESLVDKKLFSDYLVKMKSRTWVYGYPEEFIVDTKDTAEDRDLKLRLWFEGLRVKKIDCLKGDKNSLLPQKLKWQGHLIKEGL